MSLQEKIESLEKEIEALPKGYISKKNICGKVRYYLQWQENGKKRSKYIREEDVPLLEKKIAERKRKQEEVKELKTGLPEKEENYRYFTHIKIGKELKTFANGVKDYKKRDCFVELESYLYGGSDKVFILYGLRRTGKTTLIRQAVDKMTEKNRKRSAFIQITAGDDLSKVNFDLRHLEEKGYKYIFIDEVTTMSDFIEGAALLSDLFASSGMKIVLSGTDSLGFMLAESDQLYDRCLFVHTTFIPYREFERVLGLKGIDEYIHYGGTMSMGGVYYNQSTFATEKGANEYVDSAIAHNIQHSLKCYQNEGHFRHLEELYYRNELTNVINRVVEDMNHRFTLEVLTKDFVSGDLALSAKNLRREKTPASTVLDRIDKSVVTKRLKEMLEIKNKTEQTVSIDENHRKEIKEYLEILDLISDIEIVLLPDGTRNKRTVFSQPGMRYAQAKALVACLMKDRLFGCLSAEDKKYVTERILSEISGRMLEDIVLLETKTAMPSREVVKVQFAIGEFDMLVADPETLTCEIFEIKHSDKPVTKQCKNLLDEEKCRAAEFSFGKIIQKCVLYRGENCTENGIVYRNVEDYLKNLGKSR